MYVISRDYFAEDQKFSNIIIIVTIQCAFIWPLSFLKVTWLVSQLCDDCFNDDKVASEAFKLVSSMNRFFDLL